MFLTDPTTQVLPGTGWPAAVRIFQTAVVDQKFFDRISFTDKLVSCTVNKSEIYVLGGFERRKRLCEWKRRLKSFQIAPDNSSEQQHHFSRRPQR